MKVDFPLPFAPTTANFNSGRLGDRGTLRGDDFGEDLSTGDFNGLVGWSSYLSPRDEALSGPTAALLPPGDLAFGESIILLIDYHEKQHSSPRSSNLMPFLLQNKEFLCIVRETLFVNILNHDWMNSTNQWWKDVNFLDQRISSSAQNCASTISQWPLMTVAKIRTK
jgi:hypothetical protein